MSKRLHVWNSNFQLYVNFLFFFPIFSYFYFVAIPVQIEGILVRNCGCGFAVNATNATLTSCFASNNQIGLITSSPSLLATNSTFSDNSNNNFNTGVGSGVVVVGGTAQFKNCTFLQNSVASRGAGLYAENSTFILISDCTFTKNTATNGFGGGAVAVVGSSSVISNSSFTMNTAEAHGGAVLIYIGSTANISSCSFVSNWARFGAAISSIESFTTTITESTFFNNTDPLGDSILIDDSITFLGSIISLLYIICFSKILFD